MVPMNHVVLTFQYRNNSKIREIWLGLELTSDVNLDLHSWELSKIQTQIGQKLLKISLKIIEAELQMELFYLKINLKFFP